MTKNKALIYKIFNYASLVALFAMVLASIIILLNQGADTIIMLSYFTIQSNILVALLAVFYIVANIIKDVKKQDITTKLPFLIILIIILNITLTGIIYLTILLPVDLQDGTLTMGASPVANILLHAVVPVLAITYFLIFADKTPVKLRHAYVFVIYPIIYWCFTMLRSLSGVKFMGTSLYPYFFLDPEYNNQGFGMVLLYVVGLVAVFYGAGLLLTMLSNFVHKKKLAKLNESTSKTPKEPPINKTEAQQN